MSTPAFDIFSEHLAPAMAATLQRYALRAGQVQVPKPFYPEQRRIVCAANKEADGTIFVGVRHHDMSMNRIYVAMGREGDEGQVQGFLDNNSEFVTREEAWRIAFDAGQIIRRVGADGVKLYSENLY